jgi:predicted branched-subunit amino acid permease
VCQAGPRLGGPISTSMTMTYRCALRRIAEGAWEQAHPGKTTDVTDVRASPRTGSDALAAFWRGYLALLPLWSGAIPAGIAYGVAARAAGLSVLETQVMSLVVFSAAGQIGAVSLLAGGASPLLLIGTVLALNAQLLLLGVAVGRQLRLSWLERLAAAWLLTDGAYGVSLGVGPLRLAVLLGAGASMYSGWNLGTVLGAVLGATLPGPRAFGIDLVAPLAFLAVLVPLVRTRPAVLVAVVAGLTALLLLQVLPGGVAVLGAGLVGCGMGAWVTRDDGTSPPHHGAPSSPRPPTPLRAGEGSTGEKAPPLRAGEGVGG